MNSDAMTCKKNPPVYKWYEHEGKSAPSSQRKWNKSMWCVEVTERHFHQGHWITQKNNRSSQRLTWTGINCGQQTQDCIDVSINSQMKPILVHFIRCHHLIFNHDARPHVAMIPNTKLTFYCEQSKANLCASPAVCCSSYREGTRHWRLKLFMK